MKLMKLLEALDTLEINFPSLDSEVEGIHNDTRRMKPGDMFVAIRGEEQDGHAYIEEALRLGASLVVSEHPLEPTIPHVIVPDARVALAQLAACMHENPCEQLVMIGVTGTKGKTTATHLIKAILEGEAGAKVGLIGTNHIVIGKEERPAERTTPDAVHLHKLFRDMVNAGCTHCVMEVSSHALAQSRTFGIPFRVGVFTNLQHDHLDYHKTTDAYFEAKSTLFGQCEHAVVNLDDPWGRILAERLDKPLSFGVEAQDAVLRARNAELFSDAVRFTATAGAEQAPVCWHTPGAFSVRNALAALGCALALGIPLADAAARLDKAEPVSARMERYDVPADFTVIIDFAHTAEALENVLSTARGFTEGRVITVFGCGGDRDRQKRPLMGEVATRLSDVCIITSDNPRSEEPGDIIRDILQGVHGEPVVLPDRREAIHAALREAKAGDTVMLCGKGQETYQEIKGVKHPMNEKAIVSDFFAAVSRK